MRKYKKFLTKANLFMENDKSGNAPDITALFSFCLLLSWFGAAGIFTLQGYPIRVVVSLLFLAAVVINLSLIVWSVNSLLFAGMGMGTIVFLLSFSEINDLAYTHFYEFLWRIAGQQGEHILSALGFLLAFFFALSLTLLLLWFQLSKSRIWGRRVLLSTQVAMLTLSLLFLVNYRGLAATPGGMTLALVVIALLVAPVLIAVAVWFRQKQDEQLTGRIYWAAFTIQLIAVVGAVYYYAVSPTVEHLGRPVEVREIRLGDRPLSRPFVEEGATYLVSGDGRLHKVNLFTGRKQTLARILLPEPSEIGYPEYSLSVATKLNLTAGSLARMTPDKLALTFVYSLWREADQNEVNLTLEVTVSQETGQTSWQVTGFTNRPEARPAETAEYAGVTLYPFVPDLRVPLPAHMRIAGAGIETRVFTKGSVLWTYARQGWLLAGTNQGAIYIIAAGSHLAPDKR
ncbi:MAG: hypothetical protein ACYCXI_00795 [Dethiobacteraceae bacterium]